MSEQARRGTRRASAALVAPIHFRMPRPLRQRLRRFADERHLAEAEALRVVLSEHLEEVESERELASAERWQFAQAYATWDRLLKGEEATVGREEIDRIFAAAIPGPRAARGRAK